MLSSLFAMAWLFTKQQDTGARDSSLRIGLPTSEQSIPNLITDIVMQEQYHTATRYLM